MVKYQKHILCIQEVIVSTLLSLKILYLQHPDNYSRTKSIAEQEVLHQNGCKVSGGKTLKTCALRLAGVYGPGEQRHLPRIVVNISL